MQHPCNEPGSKDILFTNKHYLFRRLKITLDMTVLKRAKLQLTVDLMNNHTESPVDAAKNSLASIQGIGRFLGLTTTSTSQIDNAHERRVYEMSFENATLNLDTVSNQQTQSNFVNGFSFR